MNDVKAYGRSGGTVPLIPKLGGKRKWVVSITLRSLYARTKSWTTDLKKLWGREKLLFPPKAKPWFLHLPLHGIVGIPTELLGPTNSTSQNRSDVLHINAGFNLVFFFHFRGINRILLNYALFIYIYICLFIYLFAEVITVHKEEMLKVCL
jgi:hypothetical protein